MKVIITPSDDKTKHVFFNAVGDVKLIDHDGSKLIVTGFETNLDDSENIANLLIGTTCYVCGDAFPTKEIAFTNLSGILKKYIDQVFTEKELYKNPSYKAIFEDCETV
jgi:hypothetical protein